MRIMSLDVGTKRIGVAMSDGLLLTAQGLDTIERTAAGEDIKKICDIASSNGAVEIVVGLPLNMDGTHGAKTEEVMRFVDDLSKATKVPLKTWDERLTSRQADRIMLEGDLSRSKRKRLSDRIAAQIILQSYLDMRRTSKRSEDVL